jgi:nucleoside-triphosphatase THEP1
MRITYILTGPVRSGKTTALTEWSASRDVGGVLSPDGNGGRVFLDLMTGREEEMEANDPSADDLLVGRFRFRKAAFDFAKAGLERASQAQKDYIVVDEVGPLELQGLGLDTAVKGLLKRDKAHAVIVVVREGLVEAVVNHYDLPHVKVINKEEITQLP